MNNKRKGFTGTIGFVLAAAGSAVGLGNLWRFPYLAAKNGGGVFLVVYIALALSFGFALMTAEVALGRRTQKSPVEAFRLATNGKFTFLGHMITAVPMIIFPYYCVIGGWVLKYAGAYLFGHGGETVDATGGYFGTVIGQSGDGTIQWLPLLWFFLFLAATALFVYLGVDKGIEKCSKILMPALFVIIVFIAVYSLTLTDPESGRTAWEGFKIYITPDFTGMTVSGFLRVVLDAMGQMFYSMSLAMGIMIVYGSYMPKDTNLIKSINQIEICDTGVALLAGVIMVPAVYCFLGNPGLEKAGPSLMFVALPQVFGAMGWFGNFIGALFFLLVVFAALTSSISMMEAVVSVLIDSYKLRRRTASTIVVAAAVVLGGLTCLGYNVLYFNVTLPNGAAAQILDVFDWFANNLLMPVVAILTCIALGWVAKTDDTIGEVTLNGEKFRRKGLYVVMTKFVSPVLLLVILLNSLGVFR